MPFIQPTRASLKTLSAISGNMAAGHLFVISTSNSTSGLLLHLFWCIVYTTITRKAEKNLEGKSNE
jgi:hypothetical protein